jgi:hypothetical protein
MKPRPVKKYDLAAYPTLKERHEKRRGATAPVKLALLLATLAAIMQGCEGCWGIS